MKFKTTRKYINAVYDVYSVGYCGAQSLLYGVEPFAYNSGVYGWNCDYYYIDGVCICTGYRPHGKRVDYDILNEYEKQANSIRNDWDMSYDEKCVKIAAIREKWIDELVKGAC